MFNQVIVCEGTHDASKIKEVYKDCECVITNGSEISKETLEMIKELSKTHEIIIFTDPDAPGERIRSMVLNVVPNAKQAFIKKNLCISKNHKKVGVEHASKEDIKSSLDNMLIPSNATSDININDLVKLGLAGSSNSSMLRVKVSTKLNIGNPNVKTFLKRIKLLGLSYADLERLVGE